MMVSKKLKGDLIYFGFSEQKNELKKKLGASDFSLDLGDITIFTKHKTKILLVGLGKKKDYESKKTLHKIKTTIKSSCKNPILKHSKHLTLIPPSQDEEIILDFLDSIILGNYEWTKYKSDKSKKPDMILFAKPTTLVLNHKKILENINKARDLVNENADIATSLFMEKEIKNLIKNKPNFKLEILDEKQMKKKGLNLFLAVNSASQYKPRLIIVKYTGNKKSKNYTALIGKGMTFDSGGLNLKPTGYIETMREDMAGSATVYGVLRSVVEFRPKINLIFGFAMAENMIGPKSYKPGDVIKSYSGKTVEIKNTDAEGRLVLADSNSYITKNYPVKTTINIATLTGAVVVALGNDHIGLMSDNQELANKLLTIGKEIDDPIWQLPIYPDLKEHVKSKIADIKNIGLPKGNAGTISAGEFLRQFVLKGEWAHLDIAGTAFVDGSSRLYFSHGATGSGIKLLTYFVLFKNQ